jgi:hypothetical protein
MNYRTFYQKNSKYGLGIRDPGSGIRKKPIPDPGSRGQKGTGSRIRNTGIMERGMNNPVVNSRIEKERMDGSGVQSRMESGNGCRFWSEY